MDEKAEGRRMLSSNVETIPGSVSSFNHTADYLLYDKKKVCGYPCIVAIIFIFIFILVCGINKLI